MPPVLKALLFGNFAIGCGVSGLAATLPEISPPMSSTTNTTVAMRNAASSRPRERPAAAWLWS